jgi:hypothetical protein
MSRAQSERRGTLNSDGGIAVIWLILYAIGFLDILVFKPSPRTELALAKPEQATHEIVLLNHSN